MPAQEMIAAASEEEKDFSPSEEDTPSVLNETSAPLNFSELTPSQFGISVQSFTPSAAAASSSHRKDKSRLAQIKARRRSSVGVRGSPETNSLIRFMAQQRMKTPPTSQTPELVRSSPFLPRVASTLRQKMASFQSLMDVGESDACDPMPAQDSNTGGCIKTRDYLSDGNGYGGGKENNPPVTPTPSKRRRFSPPEGCSAEIREASAPLLHSSLKEQEADQGQVLMQVVTQGPQPSCDAVKESQPVPGANIDLKACPPTKNLQDDVFELQSLSRPPPDDPAAASLPQRSSPFHIPSLPLLVEMEPTDVEEKRDSSIKSKNFRQREEESNKSPAVKKKRVRFGGPLSPEFFDKNLPPSTPLQKGGTPARAQTPGGSLQLRSVLKTPQRSESETPQCQPDLSSPTAFGASPTLAMPHNRRMHSEGEEEDGKIVFPSIEEIGSAAASDTEWAWDAQPLNLNTAFHEESLSQTLTEFDTKASTTSQMVIPVEPESLAENKKKPEAGVEGPIAARSSNRRRKPTQEQESCSEAPARSSSRKRKLPEESEPVKRSTRSAAKSASGKMKMTSTSARRWNKDVDRSLYGSREYASKNPTLSPITERLSFTSRSPAAQRTPSVSCTVSNQEAHLNPEMANAPQVIHDLTVTDALETAVEHSVTSPKISDISATRRDSRLSGPRVRGRGLKKRKVSVVDSEDPRDQTRGETEQDCVELSKGTPSVFEKRGDTVELCAHASAHILCTDSDGKSESASDFPNDTEPAQGKAKRGRRSSANGSVAQEQQSYAETLQTSHEEQEKGQGSRAAIPEENDQSSSDSREEGGVANVDLAPWQADFNFEDVFKPVGTRGQRSVRRSLRNQSSAEHSSDSAGLAWLPRTSPDTSKEARRRTRGRRLSAALPVQPSLLEETQDAS